ncbi:hypothetical protein [Streptomyces sp. SID3343]|uniref:hypothetical protein n=1 Tax=Streptomyces sp. SID3343 TaxID=2690260 RepID=UPI0013719F84|nr:hypothetical protein [Streptomyces sp. SID3343]MYV98859.1 hypothetical protein [Streptomyces sp. SID3343]
MLPVRFAPTPAGAGRLSATTFLVARPIAAVLRIVFGTIPDLTGGYTVVFRVLFVPTVLEPVVSLLLDARHARDA